MLSVFFKGCIKKHLQETERNQKIKNIVFVVVDFLFYVHGNKHLRSCRDGQLT